MGKGGFNVRSFWRSGYSGVGAVNWKRNHHLAYGVAELGEGEILSLWHAFQAMRQGVDFALERHLQHLPFADANNFIEVLGRPGHFVVNLRHGGFIALIYKDSVETIEEIITSGAIDGPIAWQRFVAGEDFLCNDIKGPPLLQAFKVLLWVQQTVRVIDAKT